MIIAIDGPAASGKGTLARAIARHFGLPHLDSGNLYRAVAAALLDAGGDPASPEAAAAAARALDLTATGGDRLRAPEVTSAASVVATHAQVRAALLDFQRAFARRGAVIDGRDIGTVVLPDADAKLFVTAGLEERARRRAAELGRPEELDAIRADLAERDRRDTGRAVAPLRPADDALLLDTTDLDIETAFRAALTLIESRLGTAARARP